MYIDELFYLVEKINQRRITEYKMSLAIVQNPHVQDPQKLWQVLESHEKGYTSPKAEEFDELGFELLTQRMRQNPRIVVK